MRESLVNQGISIVITALHDKMKLTGISTPILGSVRIVQLKALGGRDGTLGWQSIPHHSKTIKV